MIFDRITQLKEHLFFFGKSAADIEVALHTYIVELFAYHYFMDVDSMQFMLVIFIPKP